MTYLTLTLFGPFQAALEGKPVADFESNKVRALLAYLAVESHRPHPREKLAGLLWPEWPDEAARNNLRSALANLRKVIGEDRSPSPLLCVSRQAIQFNGDSDTWVDANIFASLLEKPTPDLPNLEKATALYRGEFLEGFSMGDSAAFEEWLLLKREQYHRQALSALSLAASAHAERGDYARALPYAWRQVELEPWQEEAHCQLMRLLAWNGQRSAALAQFETCRRALAAEFNVEPAAETTRLYEQIRDGTFQEARPLPGPAPLRAEVEPRAARQVKKKRVSAIPRSILVGGLVLLVFLVAALIVWGKSPGQITSPVTAKVATLCDGIQPAQICIGDPANGSATQLTRNLDFEGFFPTISWSPDGERIVFEAVPNSKPSTIFVLDVNKPDSSLQSLGEGMFPTWSPDDAWIAFHRNGDLWIIHPDGADAHKISDQTYPLAIAWSPDSQWIAFLEKEYGFDRLGPMSLNIVRVDGSERRVLHAFDEPAYGGELAWNPEGSQILCQCGFEGEAISWVFLVDGSVEPQRINEIPASWFGNYWPQWGGPE